MACKRSSVRLRYSPPQALFVENGQGLREIWGFVILERFTYGSTAGNIGFVMSSFFDIALIDSYKNRRDFMGTGIKYLLTKTSGVLNHNAGQDFVIVPNPSCDGLVTITGLSPFSTVLVYDALGSILLNRNISDTTSCKIPLEGLSKGIYYVRVAADNGQWSCRPLCIH
jgi:hypothetical protein